MAHKRLLAGLIPAVVLLLAAVILLSAAVALAASTLTYSAAPGLAIPDAADLSGTHPGAPASSSIVVSDTGTIQDLNVSLNISHTFNSDLVITLTHVDTGTTVGIVVGAGGGGDNIVATLDDSAAAALPGGSTPPITGTFRPSHPLAAFNGQSIQGTWRLTVQDFYSLDTGTFNTWGMQAVVEQPTAAWTGWNPGDGRINPDPGAPLAIYCDADSVYAYFPGVLAFDFSLDNLGNAPAQNTLLAEGPTGARLYRLSTGELQANYAHGSEEYVLTWDACPATIITTRVYDAATRALLSEFTRRP